MRCVGCIKDQRHKEERYSERKGKRVWNKEGLVFFTYFLLDMTSGAAVFDGSKESSGPPLPPAAKLKDPLFIWSLVSCVSAGRFDIDSKLGRCPP